MIDELYRALDELDKKTEAASHREVWQRGYSLWTSDGYRRRQIANDALILYHGNGRYSFDASFSIADELGLLEPPGYNVIQAAVDTKTAHIVRNKVRPLFVTERGDSALKEKALGMQRAVETAFFQTGIYGETGIAVCRDGNLFEAGGVKWCPDYENSRILGERVFAHDVLIVPAEARLGDPRQMWHVQLIDRRVLMSQFGSSKEALELIEAAPVASADMIDRAHLEHESIADLVVVMEYWRRPSMAVDSKRRFREALGRNEKGDLDPKVDPGHDGKHVICVQGGALREEPWPFDYFPISWFKPMSTAIGFWSRGVPETLAGAQLQLNRLNDRIDKIIHLHAVPRIFAAKSARINKAKLTNDVGSVIETAIAPTQAIYVPQFASVPSELFRRIEDIIRWAEKQAGLSEMSIAAAKPPGVDHAPGMQHLADTESIRHTPAFRSWEEFHLSAATIIVDAFRMLDAYGGKSVELLWGNSKQLRRIKWRDVDLPSERYHLRVWPTNLLPMTPGARKSFVIDMLQAGLFSQQQAMAALDFPDVESIMGDTTAALENIERQIEAAKRGEPAVPEPYMDLELALRKSVDTINRMSADGEDDEAIDRVRQFWEDCNELLALQAPPPEAMPPELPPEGAPPPEGVPQDLGLPPEQAA